MIHRIFSSLASFKELVFRPGLNILIAQKEAGATDKQTRNRAGKTSVIEIIHFLTGAKAVTDSLFRSEALVNETFGITFDLGGERLGVERCGRLRSKLRVGRVGSLDAGTQKSDPYQWSDLSNPDWMALLGKRMFGLYEFPNFEGPTPTYRSLFAYFVRRQLSNAFTTPEKQASQQQTSDWQIALLYLLGLDWRIASEWQQIRDRERSLAELRKADGVFGQLIGETSELRTRLAVAEARLREMQTQLAGFRVLPEYSELESEADQLTRQINELANANVIDAASIRELKTAVHSETPPPVQKLENLYAEAGVSLPGLAIKRYEEVRSFHASVVRNRRDYLTSELTAAKQRVAEREQEKQRFDKRRAEIMTLLQSHGALEQFSRLQAEVTRKEAEAASFRQRFELAEQLENAKNKSDIERQSLTQRLIQNYTEQEECLNEAILAFEKISERLYESAGSMIVGKTPKNGPLLKFPIQGSRSKGINNMRIFCFDMMLMHLCAMRGIGPGFLVHDSHLFDGVDGRQIVSALKVGAETAEKLGFQYIVTLNEDDAFKETTEGFDARDHTLPVTLTDAREDGGLFGCRF